jgi:hypothetical protein
VSSYVVQAAVEILGSSDLPASASLIAGTTGVFQQAQVGFFFYSFLFFSFILSWLLLNQLSCSQVKNFVFLNPNIKRKGIQVCINVY